MSVADWWYATLASRCRSIAVMSGAALVAPANRSPVWLSTTAVRLNSSRSGCAAWSRFGCPSVASATSAVHHSSSWTTLAMPWSAVARPTGRYGVLANAVISWCSASWQAWVSAAAVPRAEASRRAPSARAEHAAAARSRSPGDGAGISRTTAVETTEASHQPASRSGIMLIVPGVATGST